MGGDLASHELVEMQLDKLLDEALPSGFRVLTREKRAIIAQAVRRGCSIRIASGLAQVSVETVECAIKRCNKEVRYCEFHEMPYTENALWALKLRNAEAWFIQGLLEKFESAMDKEPRAAGYYLELLSRLHRKELGRSQVMKIEQDTTVKFEWVEVTGAQWQSGRSQVSVRQDALALPPGSVEGNEIIDAEKTESQDDNEF